MHTNVPIFPRQSYRERHKRRSVPPRLQLFDERPISLVNESLHPVKLRRRRAQAPRSFYDNHEDDENEYIVSKWTIVRQRLPDILALSKTYKPATMRAQLVLLVSLMNKDAIERTNDPSYLNPNAHKSTISHLVPSNVIIDIAGRSRSICLKRIPSEQVIHVDVDGLSFSIPTRHFILAISRGYAHDTAIKYCPPAISDMLIDISKTKIIDDRRQFKRARFKMRLGQTIFLIAFILIIAMVGTLIIGATKTMFQFIQRDEWDISAYLLESIVSKPKSDESLFRSQEGDQY